MFSFFDIREVAMKFDSSEDGKNGIEDQADNA